MIKLIYIPILLLGGSYLYLSLPLRGSTTVQADPGALLYMQQENQRPVVRFTTPENGANYPVESRVPYSLNISDPEDGESKYEEIPRNHVLLKVRYVGDDKTSSATTQTPGNDHQGLLGILGSNCLNCHAFKSKLIGPSFLEISEKYRIGKLDMAQMASRIKNGSSGIWGPLAMPGHPELSDMEIEEMLLWITKEGELDLVDYYTGTEGTFLLNPPAESDLNGVFELTLTASYTDKGMTGKNRLKGEDRITIRVVSK